MIRLDGSAYDWMVDPEDFYSSQEAIAEKLRSIMI